jgi:hypothetical protein
MDRLLLWALSAQVETRSKRVLLHGDEEAFLGGLSILVGKVTFGEKSET